jgi:transcriptional regulator with XRE-family HTH domain
MNHKVFKNIRLYLGHSQESFAKELGISPGYVSLIENGHKPVSDKVRIMLARKFDITADFIETMERANRLSEV